MSDKETTADPCRTLYELYAAKRYDDLSDHLLARLGQLAERVIFDPEPAKLSSHLDWLYAFLGLFVRPDYRVSRKHIERFIRYNATISNLAALSHLGNTDAYLKLFGDTPRQVGKFLVLCSARNSASINYRALFERAPYLSNIWYTAYLEVFQAAMANSRAWENLRRHVRQAAEPDIARRLMIFPRANGAFYGCSYIDPENDRFLKHRINAVSRGSKAARQITVRNRPDPRRIAIVSLFWRRNHSVFRNFSQFVGALAGSYDLTLFRRRPAGGERADYDDVFADVVDLDPAPAQAFRDNRFGAVFFADVGMSVDSLLLSNLRLAPVQIAGVGHSVSGFGNAVDYFISGMDTETPDRPQRHYAERLVLIPGFGVIHNPPNYRPAGALKDRQQIVINCSWTAQKVNYPLVQALRRIVDGARREVVLQLFPGHALRRHAGYLSFRRELETALGADRVQVNPPQPYAAYMRAIEGADFAIDAFHYGGCNTVADCLHLGKPVVAWQGDRWYNRIGGAMLRSAGLDDLTADNVDDYVDIVLRLINDPDALASATRRVARADLAGTVFSCAAAPWFKAAVDYLLEHHETIAAGQDRSPIVISERTRPSD